jgi:TolA-binding protein
MKLLPSLLLAAALLVSARAQTPVPTTAVPAGSSNIVRLKDGRSFASDEIKRSGANVLVTVSLGTAGKSQMSFPLANVTRIEFVEPKGIKAASEALAQGRPMVALNLIAPVVAQQAEFQEIPGNYWARAATVQLTALVDLKRLAEAEILAAAIGAKEGPEQTLEARMQIALGWVKAGDSAKAMKVFEEVIAKSTRPSVLAKAWISKGLGQLEAKDYEEALLSFLRVPIFYSDQKTAMPAALLGSARAYAGLGDVGREREALEQLTSQYPNSPEATTAKPMLQRLDGGHSL